MMEESLHTRRKRIIKSYVTRLLLAGKMKMNKEFPPRPELSTKTLVEEIHKTNSDAMRMATKMDEHPFTMKECERALDDLIAKEEDDDDDDDDEEKKKKKKKKEESTPRTLKERKDGWLEKKKKFVKWHKRYEKKNGEEPVAFFSYGYATVEKKLKKAAAESSPIEAAASMSPVYISQKRKGKLERELILKHVLTARNSYWGHNEDVEKADGAAVVPTEKASTPKKPPGLPRAVAKTSPISKASPKKTTTMTTATAKPKSVAPGRVKAFVRVLDPTIPVDKVPVVPKQPILEKRKREVAGAKNVDKGSMPSSAAKKEASKESSKSTKIEQLLTKTEEEEALDGVTEKMTNALIKKQKLAKQSNNRKVNARDDAKKKKKQRKNKVEDDGDHFAQVKWIGERIPQQSKLTSNRMYYEGFIKSDIEYRVGECAYLLPGNPEEPMYIAQIESCFEDNTGKWCECRWFWRAHELTNAGEKSLPPVSKNAKDKFEPEREIMLTQTVDKQPMTCLENICHVYGSRKEADASKKTEEGGSNFEQLYCNWAYTVISATKQGKVKGVFTKVTKRKGGRGFEFPNAFSSDKKRKRKK